MIERRMVGTNDKEKATARRRAVAFSLAADWFPAVVKRKGRRIVLPMRRGVNPGAGRKEKKYDQSTGLDCLHS